MKHDFIKVIFAAALFAGCSKMSPEEKMSLHPKFPVVEGRYQITKDWTVELPGQFNRRLEDESLVIWRPGFTIWTTVWNNDHDETPEQRLSWIQAESNPDAHSQETENDGGLIRYAYRLQEESDDERRPAFYCFAIGQGGHIQMAIYFDREDDLATAKRIWLRGHPKSFCGNSAISCGRAVAEGLGVRSGRQSPKHQVERAHAEHRFT